MVAALRAAIIRKGPITMNIKTAAVLPGEQTSSTCELLRGSHASTLVDFLNLNTGLSGLSFEILAWNKMDPHLRRSRPLELEVPYRFGQFGTATPTSQTNCFSMPTIQHTPYHLARGFYFPSLTLYVPHASNGSSSSDPEFVDGAFFTTVEDLKQAGHMGRLRECSAMNDTFALGVLIERNTGFALPFARDTLVEVTVSPESHGKYITFTIKNHLKPLDGVGLKAAQRRYLLEDPRPYNPDRIDESIQKFHQKLGAYRAERDLLPQDLAEPASWQTQPTYDMTAWHDADEEEDLNSGELPGVLAEDPLPLHFNGIAFDGGIGEWRAPHADGATCVFGNPSSPCMEKPRYFFDSLCADPGCDTVHHALYCPRHAEYVLDYYLQLLHRREILRTTHKKEPKYRNSGLRPSLLRPLGFGAIR